MKRFNMRGLWVALSLLLALMIAQPQKLAAEQPATLLTAELFLKDPETYGRYDPMGCTALAAYQEAARGHRALQEEKVLIALVVSVRAKTDFPVRGAPGLEDLPPECRQVWAPGQFSWTTSNKAFQIESLPDFFKAWEAAKAVHMHTPEAVAVAQRYGPVEYFYNPQWANPAWAHRMKRVATVGAHVFLRGPVGAERREARENFMRRIAVLAQRHGLDKG